MASPSCDFVSWCHFRVIIIDVVVLLVFCGSQDKNVTLAFNCLGGEVMSHSAFNCLGGEVVPSAS
jgi:hypothetical protein